MKLQEIDVATLELVIRAKDMPDIVIATSEQAAAIIHTLSVAQVIAEKLGSTLADAASENEACPLHAKDGLLARAGATKHDDPHRCEATNSQGLRCVLTRHGAETKHRVLAPEAMLEAMTASGHSRDERGN